MSYTEWLRRQVERMESEIRSSSVFDDDNPATPAQLQELRKLVVLHTYLRQQLLRRDTRVDEQNDAYEQLLVRRA